MGQKVHPYGFRLGINKTWISAWYARAGYADFLLEDIKLREYIHKTLAHAGISKVEVERSANRVRINIHTSRPGIIIGKKGLEVDRLKEEMQAVEETIYQTKNRSNQDPLNFPIRLNNKIAALTGVVRNGDFRPTDQSHRVYDELSGLLQAELDKLGAILEEGIPAFNRRVAELNLPAVVVAEGDGG